MNEDLSPADDGEDSHEHEFGPLAELVTLRDWLRYAVSRFNRARLSFGHGTDNAYDEAAYLLLHTLALPLDRLEPFLDACITTEEREDLFKIVERRVDERLPAAYLTNEAWLGDFRFYVDERVIVPRSYFGEALQDGLAPWVTDPEAIHAALDLCTGSGCLGIIMACVFPNAHVVGADISSDALAVAHRNVEDYQLDDRVELVESDVFSGLEGRRFDLIVCNPPYVTTEAMQALPEEYRREPRLALAAGDDGMDFVRQLLARAVEHLNPEGVLAVEVGHNRHLVEAAFPHLRCTWISTAHSEDKIFVITREELQRS